MYHRPKPSSPSKHYAILGNQADTVLPIVDPATGEPMKVFERGSLKRMKKEHPEQHALLMQSVRPLLQACFGRKLRELGEISKMGHAEIEELAEQARKKIAEHLGGTILARYRHDYREKALRGYARKADILMDSLLHKYFIHYVDALGMANEVKATHDAGRLLVMAADTRLRPRVRYEARRKLLLMEMLGRKEIESEFGLSEDESLRYMVEFLGFMESGEADGPSERFMVSRHEGENGSHATKACRIQEFSPANLRGMERVTPLEMRLYRVRRKAKGGTEEAIRVYVDIREKGDFERLIKKIREDKPIGEEDPEKVPDDNGIRMIFESREDWEDFYRDMMLKLKADAVIGLSKRLEKEEGNPDFLENLPPIDEMVQVKELKDNLEGGKGFEGTDKKASSSSLKVLKFKLIITSAEGREHRYEFQIFLPDGYADYLYRKGVSWEEYSVDRFFGGVDTLLLPPAIYPKLDHNAAHEAAKKEAYRRAWEAGEHVHKRGKNGGRSK